MWHHFYKIIPQCTEIKELFPSTGGWKAISYKQLMSQHMQPSPHAASHASPSTAGRSATLGTSFTISLPKLLHTPSHMEKLLDPDPDFLVQPHTEDLLTLPSSNSGPSTWALCAPPAPGDSHVFPAEGGKECLLAQKAAASYLHPDLLLFYFQTCTAGIAQCKWVKLIENRTGKLLSSLSGNKRNENKFEQKSQIPFNE